MRILLICITSIFFIGISQIGCTIYEIDVQQGNVLDQDAINKLKIGMSKKQVLFVMGSAIIKDPFHPNRWDYVHTFRAGKGVMQQHTISVFFDKNKVVNIDESGEKIAIKVPERVKKSSAGGGSGGGHSH